jgi:hypothetical protein
MYRLLQRLSPRACVRARVRARNTAANSYNPQLEFSSSMLRIAQRPFILSLECEVRVTAECYRGTVHAYP